MHNEKWVNSANNNKHLYMYMHPKENTKIYKANINRLKENIESNTIIVRTLISHITMDISF